MERLKGRERGYVLALCTGEELVSGHKPNSLVQPGPGYLKGEVEEREREGLKGGIMESGRGKRRRLWVWDAVQCLVGYWCVNTLFDSHTGPEAQRRAPSLNYFFAAPQKLI